MDDKPQTSTLFPRLDSFDSFIDPSPSPLPVFPKLSDNSCDEFISTESLGPQYTITLQQINQKVLTELAHWEQRHNQEKAELKRKKEKLFLQQQKNARECQKLADRTELLTKRIKHMEKDNIALHDIVLRLEEILQSQSSGSPVVESLANIKEKLYEGTLNIPQEKKQHINLLKRLTNTRFNPTNEKHNALLLKFFELNEMNIDGDPATLWSYLEIGETSSILVLQNLVYCLDRHSTLATRLRLSDAFHFPVLGKQTTNLLSTLLGLSRSESVEILPVNDTSRTFVKLLDHSKAFEEIYCLCLSIYEKNVSMNVDDPLQAMERKITELLSSGNVSDIPDLIKKAS